jgi:hypothetical protein
MLPAIEADELVTKQFLRAEIAELRTDFERKLHQQTLWLGGLVITCSGLVGIFG